MTNFNDYGATVNHFQLVVPKGTVVFSWSLEGLLTQIRWYNAQSAQHNRQGLLFNTRKVPDDLVNLFERFREYFQNGVPFGEVPWQCLDCNQLTDFQKKVYEVTARIPHGETRTYSWVAEKLGSWAACRAVGQALRKNPFLILVPCHRVVASQGGLGGFMGKVDPSQPELVLKQTLLNLEDTYLNPLFPFLAGPGSEGLRLAG